MSISVFDVGGSSHLTTCPPSWIQEPRTEEQEASPLGFMLFAANTRIMHHRRSSANLATHPHGRHSG